MNFQKRSVISHSIIFSLSNLSALGSTLEFDTLKDYGHLDYMWAKDVESKVNVRVMDFIKRKREL